MKYKKGTFVVIPNKQYLKGKPSEMQSIYFWLCEHADDTGGCFPTKDTIADDAGCSHNTADKYLKQLVEEGFLRITNRRKSGSQEFTSNHYQVLIISHPPKLGSPSTNNGGTGGTNNGSETNPIINSIHLTSESEDKSSELPLKKKTKKQLRLEVPFDFNRELEALGNDNWVGNKIIYNYFKKKKLTFENYKQFDAEVSKDTKPASTLTGYNAQQINRTMKYCEDNYSEVGWTLFTCSKVISKVINQNLT